MNKEAIKEKFNQFKEKASKKKEDAKKWIDDHPEVKQYAFIAAIFAVRLTSTTALDNKIKNLDKRYDDRISKVEERAEKNRRMINTNADAAMYGDMINLRVADDEAFRKKMIEAAERQPVYRDIYDEVKSW